jgi:heme A synthase
MKKKISLLLFTILMNLHIALADAIAPPDIPPHGSPDPSPEWMLWEKNIRPFTYIATIGTVVLFVLIIVIIGKRENKFQKTNKVLTIIAVVLFAIVIISCIIVKLNPAPYIL